MVFKEATIPVATAATATPATRDDPENTAVNAASDATDNTEAPTSAAAQSDSVNTKTTAMPPAPNTMHVAAIIATPDVQSLVDANEASILSDTTEEQANIKYKKKCIELSCIISKKTVKLNNLQTKTERLTSILGGTTFLGDNDIVELDNIGKAKANDMTFVRVSLMKMYANDLNYLLDKSLKGSRGKSYRLKDGSSVYRDQKQPLTPSKVREAQLLYENRVQNDPNRISMFNRHVSNALIKIQDKQRREILYLHE